MRAVLSIDGNSRRWRAGLPARAVGKVADHRTAPERASSARRPMSVWTTIMSGPACKTSSAVASEAARTSPCIRPPNPFFFGSVCSNSPSFTQRCSPVTRSYSATPVHQERAALWQHAPGDDLSQSRSPGIEQDGPGDGIEDHQETGPGRLYEE